MNPVGDDEGVAFRLSVAQTKGAIVIGQALVVGAAGIVRNLKKSRRYCASSRIWSFGVWLRMRDAKPLPELVASCSACGIGGARP